jgi:hypothetical protein
MREKFLTLMPSLKHGTVCPRATIRDKKRGPTPVPAL